MRTYCLLALAVFASITTDVLRAADADAGKTWLLLIAVNEHDNAALNRGVANTVRDAQLLRTTLQERAGLPTEQILELSGSTDKKRQPARENLRREVAAFLAKPGPKDQLILFYSGHGVIHDGKAYLVPSDIDVKAIGTTGYALADVRDALANCQAATKFLILDCCHAGGASRAPTEASVTSEAMARALQPKKLKGTVIIASCSEDEESWEWPARQQGIFTYWLCRGLEGGADENGDGRLTFEEVYKYTYDRVPKTAKEVASASQTPVRMVGADVEGTPHLLTLLPEPPESVCRRLAEQLDLEIRRQKLKKIGVLEFTVPLEKVEGLARANLPRYCTERIRQGLAEVAAGAYEILSIDQLGKAAKGLQVVKIGDPVAMEMLQREDGLDAVIAGAMNRRGVKLHLQCDLVATASGNSLVKPTGVLPLNEELLADGGASFYNRERPNGSPYAPEVLQYVQAQNQQAHPLMDKEFPFRIEVWTVPSSADGTIIGKPKKKDLVSRTIGGNDRPDLPRSELLIGVRKNEIIEIHVKNDSKVRVAMSLLVDGVNTLGGKRQRLGEAWSWVLEPGKDYNYEGWYFPKEAVAEPNKQGFTMNRFIFRDVAPLEGREKFGDAPGIITAAFYAESGRDLKLDRLRRDEQRILQAVGFKAGRLMGVVQIRYVEEKSLDKE